MDKENEYGTDIKDIAKRYLDLDDIPTSFCKTLDLKEFFEAMFEVISENPEENQEHRLYTFLSSILTFCITKEDYEIVYCFLYKLMKTNGGKKFLVGNKYLFHPVAHHLLRYGVVER